MQTNGEVTARQALYQEPEVTGKPHCQVHSPACMGFPELTDKSQNPTESLGGTLVRLFPAVFLKMMKGDHFTISQGRIPSSQRVAHNAQ